MCTVTRAGGRHNNTRTLTQRRVFPREIREWGYFRTMRCLASLHSKQIQNSLAENKCALELMSDGGFLSVSQYLWGAKNPTIRALGSGRKLLLTAMHAPSCHVEGLAQRSEPASLAPDLFPLTLDCKLATKESYGCLCVFVTQRGEKKASCVSGVHDNPAQCSKKTSESPNCSH